MMVVVQTFIIKAFIDFSANDLTASCLRMEWMRKAISPLAFKEAHY